MSKKVFINFASGWLRNTSKGDQYISSTVNAKDGYSLVLKNKEGQEVPVTSFAVFFNEAKKKQEHPDTRFTLTIEE